MKTSLLPVMMNVFLLIIITTATTAQWSYPITKTVDSSNNYFGTIIKDPFQWLENLKDPEVLAWFKTEGEQTDRIMSKLPMRDSLVRELLDLDKLTPVRRFDFKMYHNRYFYLVQKPEEKVGRLYYRQGRTGSDILLFDPSTYPGQAGKTYSIAYYLPNYQGDKVAIGISQGGAEVATIRTLNVDTRQWYKETIYPSWFGVSDWTRDGDVFFYTIQKTDDPAAPDFILDTKSRLHKVGTDTASDRTIFSREKYPDLGIKPQDFLFVNYSEDHKYLFALLGSVSRDLNMFYAPSWELTQDRINWKRLFNQSDEVTSFVCYNDKLFFLSHKNVPKFQLLLTDIDHPDIAHAKPVRPEGKLKIESMSRAKDFLFLTLTNGINSWLWKYDLQTGASEDIHLLQDASTTITPYNSESNESLIQSTTWNLPPTLYDYDAGAGNLQKSTFQMDIKYPGLEKIKVKEVEVPSYDGTMVPLSIIYRDDIKLDGNNSCILDAYGAYGISWTPAFSISRFSLVNKGVVYAFAHVRGGGEKGETWYRGGYKATKPNTWKDFIACGEYLIRQGYTSTHKLGGTGTSAGGILIGRAITERPDLFAAAVCNVGCANALRLEKMPAGATNTQEFGTVTDPADCKALVEMDALSHVQKGVRYPAVLCATGINDPRVAPWQPGKFAAALQNASASERPVLLRVDYDNGHFTNDKIVSFKSFADQSSFLLWQTGHPAFQ